MLIQIICQSFKDQSVSLIFVRTLVCTSLAVLPFLLLPHLFFLLLLSSSSLAAKYKYSTVELFLEDLELMAKNCELYNGSQHFSSQYARQIYTETLELIHVDRDILGRDKDPYTIQQNDIQAKYSNPSPHPALLVLSLTPLLIASLLPLLSPFHFSLCSGSIS
jgi:hypothetical protein